MQRSNRFGLVLGLVFVLGGALLLAGNIFQFNAWAVCWPAALMALGGWFVYRAGHLPAGRASTFQLMGDITRSGPWQVAHEEINLVIGDIELDMTQAAILLGETRLQFSGFVNDITLFLPAGVGVSLTSTAFVSSVSFLGFKRDSILTPLDLASIDYASAERRLRVEASFFVADIKIRQG